MNRAEVLKKSLALIDELHCERDAVKMVLGCSYKEAELFIESSGVANYLDYTAYSGPFNSDEERKKEIKKAIKRLWTSTQAS